MDNSIQNVEPPDEASGDTDLCANLSTLAVQGTPPAVGDMVSVTVEGTVTRIDGEHAYITPEKINGEDVSHGNDGSTDDGGMEAKAAAMDKSEYG